MNSFDKTVLLLSGGIDSVTLLHTIAMPKRKVICLSFDYGQRHIKELQCARYHCVELNVPHFTLHIPQLKGSLLTDSMGGVVVPMRNAVFLSHAVNFAVANDAKVVAYACNSDDAELFADCRMPFVEAINAVIKQSGYDVEVECPFIDKTKASIVALAHKIPVDLDQTWSCYSGLEKPCGICVACQKRALALG